MKLTRTTGALLMTAGLAMLPLLPADAAGTIKPGNWEFTTRLQTATPPKLPAGVTLPAGMKLPAAAMAVTHRQCIDTEKSVPSDPRQGCKIDKIERRAETISWWTTCQTAQGEAHSAGTARYSGDTMVASVNTRVPNGSGGTIDTAQQITGRYLGACTK